MNFNYVESIYISEEMLDEIVAMCKNDGVDPTEALVKMTLKYFTPDDWEWDKLQQDYVTDPIICEIRTRLWRDGYEEKWIKENE